MFVSSSRTRSSVTTVLSAGGAICAALVGLAQPANAQLLNGSFESVSDPLAFVTGYQSAELYGAADDWTVGGVGAVGFTGADFTTDGIQAALFNSGNQPAGSTLSQTFTTKPFENYSIAFDFGGASGNEGTEDMLAQALNGAAILGQTQVVDPVPGTLSRTGFSTYSFTFESNAAATTLRFNDIGSDTNAIDSVLDNVKLADLGPGVGAANAPEPGSLSLLVGLGLFCGASALRRRRISIVE